MLLSSFSSFAVDKQTNLNMKFFIVFAALFAVALAAPSDSQTAETLRYDNDNIGLDKYSYFVETSDGKSVSETGELTNVGTDHESLAVHGSFSYVGEDGVTYSVTYVADENGFQPSGAHLPVAPTV